MTRPSLALVVHGAHWPDAHRATTVRDQWSRVAGTSPDVVVARDEPTRPRGAAACIDEAVRHTSADIVIVCDSTSSYEDAVLGALLGRVVGSGSDLADAAAGGDALAHVGACEWIASWPDGADLLAEMARHVDAPPPVGDDPGCWVVRRDAWEAVGGLDVRLWSVGAVADLAARLRAHGYRTSAVAMTDAPTTAVSCPLSPDVRTLLAWRNALISLVKTTPDATLGPTLTLVVTALLGAAWRGTGLRAGDVTFGGAWGRASIGQRLRTRLGGRAAGDLWPADEAATALPLAALQSFASELPVLLEQRRAAAPHRGGAPHGDATSSATSATSAPSSSAPHTADFRTRPRVSVIVVTWNGLEHLDACFSSVLASDYPADLLEVVCVDNGSTDGTAAFLAQRFPSVRVVALTENRGFTGGNAAGVHVASGDVLVFLNNDMRVEPTLVARLVDGLGGDTACTGARVMSWDGQRIDFVRGTASFEARGFQELYQQRYHAGMQLADSFFPNGGAFAVTRAAYDDAGGFDPRLFAYYDDLDLGWRLRAAGYTIRTVPDAVAYHRHGATVRTQPGAHKRWLMERNALWIALRNYDDDALSRVAPALLLLAGLRVAQNLTWLASQTARRLRAWLPSPRAVPARDVYDVPERAAAEGRGARAPAGPRADARAGGPGQRARQPGGASRRAPRQPGPAAPDRRRGAALPRPAVRIPRWTNDVQEGAARPGRSPATQAGHRPAAARAARDARGPAHEHVGARRARAGDGSCAQSNDARDHRGAGPRRDLRRPPRHRALRPCGSGRLARAGRLGRHSGGAGLRAAQLSLPDTARRAAGRRPLLPVHPRVPRTVTFRTARGRP